MSKEGITIEDYTDKSFVVRGETQQYKDDLRALGGKWNSRLTDRTTGDHFGAWIYPKVKEGDVNAWVSGKKRAPSPVARPTFESTSGNFKSSSGSSDRQVLLELKQLNTKIDRMYKLLNKLAEASEISDVEDEEKVSSEEEEEVAPVKRLMVRPRPVTKR